LPLTWTLRLTLWTIDIGRLPHAADLVSAASTREDYAQNRSVRDQG
jgi:hypothetical protein